MFITKNKFQALKSLSFILWNFAKENTLVQNPKFFYSKLKNPYQKSEYSVPIALLVFDFTYHSNS